VILANIFLQPNAVGIKHRGRTFWILVFGNQVRIVKQDIDRYGRIVGIEWVWVMCA
jgi:hypothetical protein